MMVVKGLMTGPYNAIEMEFFFCNIHFRIMTGTRT